MTRQQLSVAGAGGGRRVLLPTFLSQYRYDCYLLL